ncbi:Fc.00g031820.m01.CDS01 [Cosmosporella sp. VM-42]
MVGPYWKEWFERACNRNVEEVRNRRIYNPYTLDHPNPARDQWVAAQPATEASWSHYKDLPREQQEVLRSNGDALALQYGLERFPSLKKITLTPATHGTQFSPLYQTPMIRSFPYGFNYPIPRGWPAAEEYSTVRIDPWNAEADGDKEQNRWRGFRIITWILARTNHRISEFVVDVSLLNTGLNWHIFDQPCDEYNDLVRLLLRPGFRRFDLALLVPEQGHAGWPAFRNGRLQRALGGATGLEHDAHSDDWEENDNGHFIPLRTIFPVDKWPKLRHFGLSGFIVRLVDAISLLASLPTTAQSVELSFLLFQKQHGKLLIAMRNTLDWRERSLKPKVIMGSHLRGKQQNTGRVVWVDNEIYDFIYGNRENPFNERNSDGIYIGSGVGKRRVRADRGGAQ